MGNGDRRRGADAHRNRHRVGPCARPRLGGNAVWRAEGWCAGTDFGAAGAGAGHGPGSSPAGEGTVTPAAALASNLKKLREARGVSQSQIARLAGIPRATWSNLEAGGANPTLAVLAAAAGTLQVSIEELLAPPRTDARLVRVAELPVRRSGSARIRRLLPDPVPGTELERFEIAAQGRFSGVPHTPGTREYLTCESGEIELNVAGERYRLTPGDVVSFRGDQRHGYASVGLGPAVGYSVVLLAPG